LNGLVVNITSRFLRAEDLVKIELQVFGHFFVDVSVGQFFAMVEEKVLLLFGVKND
jgi:proline racemase